MSVPDIMVSHTCWIHELSGLTVLIHGSYVFLSVFMDLSVVYVLMFFSVLILLIMFSYCFFVASLCNSFTCNTMLFSCLYNNSFWDNSISYHLFAFFPL